MSCQDLGVLLNIIYARAIRQGKLKLFIGKNNKNLFIITVINLDNGQRFV